MEYFQTPGRSDLKEEKAVLSAMSLKEVERWSWPWFESEKESCVQCTAPALSHNYGPSRTGGNAGPDVWM